jgi:hypothetical protein
MFPGERYKVLLWTLSFLVFQGIQQVHECLHGVVVRRIETLRLLDVLVWCGYKNLSILPSGMKRRFSKCRKDLQSSPHQAILNCEKQTHVGGTIQ